MVRGMGGSSGMSRRGFIIAAGSAAAMVAVDGCSGGRSARGVNRSDAASGSVPTTTTIPPRQAGQRPDLTKAEGTDLLPQIEHIVVVMQENHSYDSYFGMLGRGDGFTLDSSGKPTASNADAQGSEVRAFHAASTCQAEGLSQNWNSSHIQWNNGAMDGFVRSPSGAAAMAYWDGRDIPFYYSLAKTFPLCDRWFASC